MERLYFTLDSDGIITNVFLEIPENFKEDLIYYTDSGYITSYYDDINDLEINPHDINMDIFKVVFDEWLYGDSIYSCEYIKSEDIYKDGNLISHTGLNEEEIISKLKECIKSDKDRLTDKIKKQEKELEILKAKLKTLD